MAGLFRKNKDKLFGEIAISKGLATKSDIIHALQLQKDFLEKQNIHRAIGAILIENGVITPEDVEHILEEQKNSMGWMAWIAELFSLSR